MSKHLSTNTNDVGAPAARRSDIAQSTFNWRTGSPSIFYTPAGHREAIRQSKGSKNGKALDSKGRPNVDMGVCIKGSIRIATPADSLKTQRIKRGTSI